MKYFAALLLFGSNGIIAEPVALESNKIVLVRTLLGSLLLVAIFLLSGQKFTFRRYNKDLLYIAVSGIAMGAGWMFLFNAYKLVGVGIASLLYYCGPIIVMVLSPLFFAEKITAAKALGFAAVLGGVFLVNGSPLGSGNFFG